MKIGVFTLVICTGLTLISCNEVAKSNNKEAASPETVIRSNDEIATNTAIDESGRKLVMEFNNTKDIVTVKFNDEMLELVSQKPASGIWYKNDHYELRGKGEEVELLKDGQPVFNNNKEASNIVNADKLTDDKWWVGKHFTTNNPVSKNPEEGGADFLIINQNNTAEYKMGDIVQTMSWVEKDGEIILKDKLMNTTIKLKIVDNFLTDGHHTKWVIKK